MTLIFPRPGERAGDFVKRNVEGHLVEAMGTDFIKGLHDGTLPHHLYLQYIRDMYIIVTGFCGGLGRMIGKFDAVTDARLLINLYRQGTEEIGHNNLWRAMLTHHGIDHAKLYDEYRAYRASFSMADWSYMSEWVGRKSNIWCPEYVSHRGLSEVTYPQAILPHPILALAYHMEKTSDGNDPWIYFSCQTAIETCLVELVSYGLPNYIKANPQLFNDPVTTAWWREHTKTQSGQKGSDEERHVRVSWALLNRNAKASEPMHEAIRITLKLFVTVMMWSDRAQLYENEKWYAEDPNGVLAA